MDICETLPWPILNKMSYHGTQQYKLLIGQGKTLMQEGGKWERRELFRHLSYRDWGKEIISVLGENTEKCSFTPIVKGKLLDLFKETTFGVLSREQKEVSAQWMNRRHSSTHSFTHSLFLKQTFINLYVPNITVDDRNTTLNTYGFPSFAHSWMWRRYEPISDCSAI